MSPEPAGHDIDLDDPRLAVKVATLTGQLALLSQSTSMSIANMANSQASMQADLRDIGKMVNDIKTEQHEVRSHSEGLDRLGKAIEKAVESWDRRFQEHAAENNKTADTVKNFTGGLKVAALVFVMLSALATAYITTRFDATNESVHKVERRVDRLEGL